MTFSEKSFLSCQAFSAFFESLDAWRRECGKLKIVSTMTQQDYDVLLKGVDADVYIPVWASAAMGEGKPLMDQTTLEVITFYKENGYIPVPMDYNPPDYLGQQFRFLAYLYACGKKDPGFFARAKDFENTFTVVTVTAFIQAVQQYSRPLEVDHLCQRLSDYLLEEYIDFSEKQLAQACIEMEQLTPGAPQSVETPHVIASAGLSNCGGKCRIDVTVAEGCALGISTDCSENHPQIRACVRGRAYRHTFLSPHRLRYPMKRIGQRGEGKFCRISWEEAAREIAAAAKRFGSQYGPESRYVMYSSGNCAVMRGDRLIRRILNLDGGFLNFYNSYSSACSTYVSPYIYGDSNGGHTERDMLNSKLLILWGHNPSETIFGSLRNRYLAEAKARGIPILVIDPRCSDTAMALAEKWIPLRPTTDGALADAMAYTIVKNGLHDLEFLHTYCVGFDEQTLPAGVKPGSSYESYLFGRCDGVIKDSAWGETVTGVPAALIEELAIRYATTKPACILTGLGPQRNGNGEQGTRAIAALCCLTGNVGKHGGSSGLPSAPPPRPQPVFPIGEPAYPGKIPTFLWSQAVDDGIHFEKRRDGLEGVDKLNSNIKLLFNIAGNTLINQHSDINATAKLLKDTDKCEMIIVSDLFMTSSARYADLLLPAASLLECNNITAPWYNDDCLLSNSRVVAPLFETMDDFSWTRMVAKEMGVEDAFAQGRLTQEEWLRYLFEEHRKAEPLLPDYDSFRRNGGVHYLDAPLRIAYRENIEEGRPFSTPSGKIELYSSRIAALGDPRLPGICCYVPAPEGPTDALRKQYPLQMVGYHTKRRCHSIHDQNDWLEEVDPPAIWIHPEDAKARGIREGDMVDIFNDRGTVRIPAKVTERIMRGVTAMSQGGWYTPDKKGVDTRGSINVLTRFKPTPLAKGNPQHTNLVEVRKAFPCKINQGSNLPKKE